MTDEPLLTRIRAEYLEMPGLRLTTAQACRLWQLDAATCQTVLARLLDEHFLHCTRDGAYVAFPATRPAVPGTTSSAAAIGRRDRRSA